MFAIVFTMIWAILSLFTIYSMMMYYLVFKVPDKLD